METDVTPNSIINDVVNKYPQTMKIFSKYQLDTCCGGFQEIGVAAKLFGADIEQLMEELKTAITAGQ